MRRAASECGPGRSPAPSRFTAGPARPAQPPDRKEQLRTFGSGPSARRAAGCRPRARFRQAGLSCPPHRALGAPLFITSAGPGDGRRPLPGARRGCRRSQESRTISSRPAAGSRPAAAPAAHRDLAGRESGTLRPARRGPGCPVFSSSPFLRHCALTLRQARQACSRPSALARPVHLPREARARSQSRARTRLGRVGTAGMTGGGRRQHPGLS